MFLSVTLGSALKLLSSDGANSAKHQVTERDEKKEDGKAEESKEKVEIVTEGTDKQPNSTDTPTVSEQDAKKDDKSEEINNDAASTDPAEDKENPLVPENNTGPPFVNSSVADAPKTGEAGTTDDSPKTPVADVPKTGDAPKEKMSADDVLTVLTSAAEVPAPVKEMTVQKTSVADVPNLPTSSVHETSAADVPKKGDAPEEKTSAADVPTVPTSAAEVPTPVKEMTVQETSVADVPTPVTDLTVPSSPSVATTHESATDLTVQPTDSMSQTSQKEYQDAFGPQGERMWIFKVKMKSEFLEDSLKR